VAIIIRKLLLSLITKGIIIKNSSEDADSTVRQALCNMTVLVIACTAQARAMPFAHSDANIAELGLLLCAVLLILVGMGTREVRDPKTNKKIDDPADVEAKLSTAESGAFYLVIYLVMASAIGMTLLIILRRVGALRHQLMMGRQRTLTGCENDDDEGIEHDDPDGALPDEIAALIHKSRIEAASGWFNEKENDRTRSEGHFLRLLLLCRQCCRHRSDDASDANAAWANYKVVHTKLFLPKVPAPGVVSQLKKRLRRKLGVLKVHIDEENCTVFVEHDLSVSSARAGETIAESDVAVERRRQFLAEAPGGGSERVTTARAPNGIGDLLINAADGDLRRNAAAHELARVVNSVIKKSRVYIASEKGKIKVRGRSLKLTFIGVLLVALHLTAGTLDCKRVSTVPMSCDMYRTIFGKYNESDPINDNGILPARQFDIVTQLPLQDNVSHHNCSTTTPMDSTDIASDHIYFAVECKNIGTYSPGCYYKRDGILSGCTFAAYMGPSYDAMENFTKHNDIKKTKYRCVDFQYKQDADREKTILPWVKSTTQELICNFKRELLMLIACIVCSLPLLTTIVSVSWRRYRGQGTSLTSVVPQKTSVVPHISAIVAVVISCLIEDYEGAAAVAAMTGFMLQISKHARNKATTAVEAAIVRVSQDSGMQRTIRNMGTEDEDKINDLRKHLRDAAENNDRNSKCFYLAASIYTVGSILAAACIGILPWILHNEHAVLWTKVAAVFLVSARPNAVLIAKTAPFWCSVATSARYGFLSQQYLEVLVGHPAQSDIVDDSASDQHEKRRKIVRALHRTTWQNMCISLVGRLVTLATVTAIVIRNYQRAAAGGDINARYWYHSPWYALLVELLVTTTVALNSTRCAASSYC
jgi:hypothetical protein